MTDPPAAAAAFRGASQYLKMTERFKPIGPNTVEWSVKLDDPHTWARPWTFAVNLTRDESKPCLNTRATKATMECRTF